MSDPSVRKIGRYEILDEIGRGGYATVYEARDPALDRVVALKVLHQPYTERPDVVQRFQAEARRAARLRHSGIVRILEVGKHKGQSYIAMDYLPGGALSDRLGGEPLPFEAALTILEQVAGALDYAHKRKLVHRDVKPANILFDDEGGAVLADFGLVKSLVESGLTIEGTTLGTPHYMAPEQAETSAEVDARADVYALGVVAYEMLTGRMPFEADTPLAVLRAHAETPPPDPRQLNQALDEGLAEALLKALAKAPAGRYPGAGAFARALREAWEVAQETAQTKASLEDLYAQAQEAMKAGRWGLVVTSCVEIRNLDPDYRDVGALLTLAASRLAEEEQKRQQERDLGEQYAAALASLAEGEYAEALEALETIAEGAPDFKDVSQRLEEARAGLERAGLYAAALDRLAAGCHDEACQNLLAVLRLDPGHAEARARLPEAIEGALAQLGEARKAGGECQALRARLGELEARLKEAQAVYKQLKKLESEAARLRPALETAQSLVDSYDRLLLAMEDREREQVLALAEELAQAELPGASRLLARLQAEAEAPKGLGRRPSANDLRISPKDSKEMVRVPAGEFLYGDDKKKIELPEFWIDKTPVTNAEYARFVAETGHKPPQHWEGKTPSGEIADHPVTYVSWHDAVAYAEWAGKRLPTEQEWEKAARGVDGREYPWGEWKEGRCNSEEAGVGGTTPVGQYSPQFHPELAEGGDSPYGCVDMAGNVWEWTASDHEAGGKVLRGGSFAYDARGGRGACRYRLGPNYWYKYGGFRCVLRL